MSEEELKEKISKDLKEIFDAKTITNFILDKIKINELAKIAVVLVINNVCYAISNFLFTYMKHFLRIKLCRRLGIEPTERNIAVMESMEYQSV